MQNVREVKKKSMDDYVVIYQNLDFGHTAHTVFAGEDDAEAENYFKMNHPHCRYKVLSTVKARWFDQNLYEGVLKLEVGSLITKLSDLEIEREKAVRLYQIKDYSERGAVSDDIAYLGAEIEKIKQRINLKMDGLIINKLTHLGITPRLNGFGYAREAVKSIFWFGDNKFTASGDLYPLVESKINPSSKDPEKTCSNVERSIRYALVEAWEADNQKVLDALELPVQKKMPTVMLFLKAFTQVIKKELL